MLEKQLKTILQKNKKDIRSIWIKGREISFLVLSNQEKIKKSASKLVKNHTIKVFLVKNYFENIFEGNLDFYESINQADILYDPHSFIDPIKKMVASGKIMGTKQSFLLKFLKISDHFKKVNSIKFDVLNNAVLLIVESSQAALLEYADKVPPLKKVPEYLEKYLIPKGLEKRYVVWIKKTIEDYRNIEHGKMNIPSGEQLDQIQKRAEDFRDRISSILDSQ